MAIDQQTAYALSAQKAPDGAAPAKGGDAVRFWRERRFDDLECLKARFFRHAYAPHAHDTFAIGVILAGAEAFRSEEHTSERQSLMRISYAVFCLKQKKQPEHGRTGQVAMLESARK